MRALVAALWVGCGAAHAYDSVCVVGDRVCSSSEAARLSWGEGEHAEIWTRSRALAGLPDAVDAEFVVVTPTLGATLADGSLSLAPAPLDGATTLQPRRVRVPLFAQLPDFSFALWDWTAGNEGCPPDGTAAGAALCHQFEGHLSWLNASHFVPMAGDAFARWHRLALERARVCAALPDFPATVAVRESCDREALLLEAAAHHHLQDAWSMGHMWQRWGGAAVGDFEAVRGDFSLEEHAKLVGMASGILHGAKAITGFDDALCAPGDGVEFDAGDHAAPGAGDLFWDRVDGGGHPEQRVLMLSCLASAQREVYAASAKSLGPLAPLDPSLQVVDPLGPECLGQRATNRAMFIAAAIDLPGLDADLDAPLVAFLDEIFQRQLQLGAEDAARRRVPLTAEVLGQVLVCPTIESCVRRGRWAEDMRRIRDVLNVKAALAPGATSLADGALGELLGMAPNSAYGYDAAADYLDPPLPWTPTPTSQALSPVAAHAGDILARTFVDAHALDWCGVLTVDGADEFSLERLRQRCAGDDPGDELDDDERRVACEVCGGFARFAVVDPAADSEELADEAVCPRLVPGGARVELAAAAGEDRRALAQRWCRDDLATVVGVGGGFHSFASETTTSGFNCEDDIEVNSTSDATLPSDQALPVRLDAGASHLSADFLGRDITVRLDAVYPPAFRDKCNGSSVRSAARFGGRLQLLVTPQRAGHLTVEVRDPTSTTASLLRFANRQELDSGVFTTTAIEEAQVVDLVVGDSFVVEAAVNAGGDDVEVVFAEELLRLSFAP